MTEKLKGDGSILPRGPKGEKRPADVIGAAVMVGRIATGEIEEGSPPDDGKDPAAAVALGRKGWAAPRRTDNNGPPAFNRSAPGSPLGQFDCGTVPGWKMPDSGRMFRRCVSTGLKILCAQTVERPAKPSFRKRTTFRGT